MKDHDLRFWIETSTRNLLMLDTTDQSDGLSDSDSVEHENNQRDVKPLSNEKDQNLMDEEEEEEEEEINFSNGNIQIVDESYDFGKKAP